MNYENGKIYCIRNKSNNLIYIGSTCQPLYKRFHQHKIASKKGSMKLYQHFKDIGIENFYIELIEDFPCENKNELRAKEQYYCRAYDTFTNGLNKISAFIDDVRINDIKEQKKKYYDKYYIEYYQNNQDAILENKKEYYNNKKNTIIEKAKVYYQNNRCKYICDICNYNFCSKKDLSRHNKTKKHQNNANKLIN
jgi:hypothetical protein